MASMRKRGQGARATFAPINGEHMKKKFKSWTFALPLKAVLALSISLLSILYLFKNGTSPIVLDVDTPNPSIVMQKTPPRKFTKVPKEHEKTFYWDGKVVTRPMVRSLRARGWRRVNDKEHAHFIYQYATDYELSKKLKPWQRFCHIPGIRHWNTKDLIVDGFKAYQEKTGRDLFFLPDTYRLNVPEDVTAFEHRLFREQGINIPWVLKEPTVNQGRGVTIMAPNSKKLRNVPTDLAGERYIIQKYICNELTWNKRKFDVRMFWFVSSIDPLIVFYHDGYARVGNSEYNEADFSNTVSHLTTHTGLGEEGKGTFDELRQRIMDHYESSPEVLLGHIRDPIQHVRNQFKHTLSELIEAFKQLSFSPGPDELSSENGLGFYGADFAIDNDLDVWLIEPQKGCGLDEDYHFRVEMHDQLFSGMVDIMQEIWQKQEAGEPVLPFENPGKWEVIYADGWQYTFEGYKRSKNKKQCGAASSS
jgi:hypothetical protein